MDEQPSRSPLATWIREQLDARQIKQNQAARYMAVSQSMLSQWLRDMASPSRQSVRKVAAFFDAPLPEVERLVRESTAWLPALESRPLGQPKMVPLVTQTATAGIGGYTDAEMIPHYPAAIEWADRWIAVRVAGECLVPRLQPGHIAFVNLDAQPRPGGIVLALVDGQEVFKIFQQGNGQAWLEALDGSAPITIDDGVRIQGVVREARYVP